eukprot:CAMPEP_0194279394 /NCGR_PEP_ID=MMETSP0169-20130528/13905_1 /TAXON_ID=218684 /ORGANISM="Corethron pennatum, Strain L29A3" /LENGTH=198 /DNA_ID=CAMNT_0039023811 /DNA_START=833 /DNA_END=1427 /DNA_ORIENTATION=+
MINEKLGLRRISFSQKCEIQNTIHKVKKYVCTFENGSASVSSAAFTTSAPLDAITNQAFDNTEIFQFMTGLSDTDGLEVISSVKFLSGLEEPEQIKSLNAQAGAESDDPTMSSGIYMFFAAFCAIAAAGVIVFVLNMTRRRTLEEEHPDVFIDVSDDSHLCDVSDISYSVMSKNIVSRSARNIVPGTILDASIVEQKK